MTHPARSCVQMLYSDALVGDPFHGGKLPPSAAGATAVDVWPGTEHGEAVGVPLAMQNKPAEGGDPPPLPPPQPQQQRWREQQGQQQWSAAAASSSGAAVDAIPGPGGRQHLQAGKGRATGGKHAAAAREGFGRGQQAAAGSVAMPPMPLLGA